MEDKNLFKTSPVAATTISLRVEPYYSKALDLMVTKQTTVGKTITKTMILKEALDELMKKYNIDAEDIKKALLDDIEDARKELIKSEC